MQKHTYCPTRCPIRYVMVAALSAALLLLAACQPIVAPPDASSEAPTGTTTDAAGAEAPFIIENVRVFDGEQVIPETSVAVGEDGLIAGVGGDVEVPPGAQRIDGTGKTLLPGLIDAHTHVFGEDALRQALVLGVTTELDMFMDQSLAAQLRAEQAETGATQRADLFSAGTLATAPGGHGTQFGLPVETLTSPDQAEAFVEARIAEGSDYLKIILDDGSELGAEFPTLDPETVAALVQAAHGHGLMTLTHVMTLAAARQALEAGTDGLAHIFEDALPDEEFIEDAVESDLFVIATLAVFQSIGGEPVDTTVADDPHLAPYLTQADLQSLGNPYSGFEALSFADAQESVRLLHEAGIRILAGTDAPNPGTTHGASIHRELVLLTGAGLSPLEALRAATSVTADTFSLSDRGRIAPGLRADLLLVNGDPTEEITATRDIEAVWKLGVPVDRAAYLDALEAQRAEAAAAVEEFAAADVVMIGDFESETLDTSFGSGWQITTDQPAGGSSVAEMEIVADGANGTDFSLLIAGETSASVPFAWAGTMFMPGLQPFAPFDLSSKPTLHFWAKGEGGPFRVQLFCENLGQVPADSPISVTEEWQEFSVDLGSVGNCDPSGVMAIIFSAGPGAGEFSLQLDEISLR